MNFSLCIHDSRPIIGSPIKFSVCLGEVGKKFVSNVGKVQDLWKLSFLWQGRGIKSSKFIETYFLNGPKGRYAFVSIGYIPPVWERSYQDRSAHALPVDRVDLVQNEPMDMTLNMGETEITSYFDSKLCLNWHYRCNAWEICETASVYVIDLPDCMQAIPGMHIFDRMLYKDISSVLWNWQSWTYSLNRTHPKIYLCDELTPKMLIILFRVLGLYMNV